MAKQKRRLRVGVPLDSEVHEVLDRYCDLTGRSKSSICEEIIAEATPVLEQMMIALQSMGTTPAGGIRQMALLMEKLAFEAKQMGLQLEAEEKSQ